MSEQLAEEVFGLAAEGLEVGGAPVAAVVARARSRRRRQRRIVAAAVAGTLAAVGLGTWIGVGAGGGQQAADRPPVTRVANPADVAWWANDVLHLPHVALELPRVEDLVQVGDGAVIGDEQGRVLLVDGDGALTTLGHKIAGAPLVASDHQQWVAWVDPRDRSPQLVVYDLASHGVLATQDLPYRGERWNSLDEGSFPIAVDGDTLYYAAENGDWSWIPAGGVPARLPQEGLLDVAAATIVRDAGDRGILIVQPFFSVEYVRPGSGAQVSPAGDYVLTRGTRGRSSGPFGRVLIYDTRSGERVWTGLGRRDAVVAATLGPLNEVSYVLAHAPDQPQGTDFVRLSFTGPYELRTCYLAQHSCTQVAKFPHTGGLPVLAAQ